MHFFKILVSILFTISGFITRAGIDGDSLISRFHPGSMWYYTGLRPAKEGKVRKYDRLVFDIAYNTLSGRNSQLFQQHWSSISLNVNFLFDIPLNKTNTIAFGTGLCYGRLHIRHDNTLQASSDGSYTVYLPKEAINAYNKSVLGGNNFSLPLELRFRKPEWKHTKFIFGGKIGYQTTVFNKYVIRSSNEYRIVKFYSYPDIQRITYAVHARIGFRNWALYGSYNFNPVFHQTKSISFNSLQVGISISLF